MTIKTNKKLIYILAGVALLALVIVGVFVWNNYQISITPKPDQASKNTSEQAIQTIKNQRPEFKDYPSNALPPRSVISEQGEDNGWYVAFVQEGSGRPIISATCFFIDKNSNILSEKKYTPDISENTPAKFSAKTCSPGNCALETCHGLDIKCGSNPPDVCTEMYQVGDICLNYAKCGIVNNTCRQIDNKEFTTCKSCVETCMAKFQNDNMKLFDCESKCRK